MSDHAPLWIKEAEIVSLMDLHAAIGALEADLRSQAAGAAINMGKTHASWAGGSTLHAIGAVFEADGVVGTKTWAHTEGGATPLLILWNSDTGALLAIIEAFAMGQMRTASVSAVATRYLSVDAADTFALIGTGKQALAQLAAVAAVRPLKDVRIWGRNTEKRDAFAEQARGLGYDFRVNTPGTVAEAVDGAAIVTTVTRAREPFLTADMVAPGTHINAVGAITGERQELAQDVFPRASVIAADDPGAVRRLSSELIRYLGDAGDWSTVRPLADVVAGAASRPQSCDLTIFKSMGMGISDLSLGVEIYRRARAAGLGTDVATPVRSKPHLGPLQSVGDA
ncbi:ornithine cyclodeaminase family protein [Novosphingobium beihaiensis]|uniref:Ornithine cyclodeaminase family protein n=1 Tax=Novosphingobium beihaiensis TaxID=2930389 RepID=A0ABT0BRE7_9SPHN|nr:ornithine cyclodeaminase family protein [Novosphingobium beihaiensis]MCJ2187624.1 ornithine cyclodeaminase family protein [Novosphingobium beihaiensis]